MKNILAVVIMVLAAQVQAETNTDVIASFVQIFEKLHQDISDIQTVAHSSAYEISRRLTLAVRNSEAFLTRDQNEAKATLAKDMKEQLDGVNLSPDNEEVKKCVAETNTPTLKMLLRSEGGLQVCKTTDAELVEQATVLLNEVYGKQAKQHYKLEDTKSSCNSTANDPGQLRNCLYYQLFVVHVDLVKELKEDSEQVLKNYETVFEKVADKLMKCSTVVKKNILEEVRQILLKFHSCVYEILLG